MTLKRALLIASGFAALTLGAIGIVVPVLPTTPFVLLAAGCFAKSSPRFFQWLHQNRVFGPFIDNYRNGTGVPRRLKIGTLVWLWTMLTISSVLVQRPLVYAILAAVGVAVTWHVLSLKPKAEATAPALAPAD